MTTGTTTPATRDCRLTSSSSSRATEELREKHLELGAEITRTCYEVYHRMPTGIFPEVVRFDDNENDFRCVIPHVVDMF